MELSLTKSEKEVVKLKALGYGEKQIASVRFNSINTIKTHVRNALEKNNLKNGFELVARYAANHPNMFRNMIVALFMSIQGLTMISGDDIYRIYKTKTRVKISRVKRIKY
ncbi:LuxR C-terminal-related transcriptional regulator [uncultured Wocania sp.]|uniref:response regulator transcription factor n=1 Tax=uncultured Wocania sp. TaxID=2834404 RepID=UPI0030F9D3B9